MQEVLLVIHLMLAVVIIALVLLQRSSGGGLGIGGGGLGDFASARSTANVLTKATTFCAILFFITSLSLAYIAKGTGAQKGLLEDYQPTAAASAPADADGPQTQAPATPEPNVPVE